jgi:response regulator of citrate/malate metabolism
MKRNRASGLRWTSTLAVTLPHFLGSGMPANRKTMRKIREVLRLKFEADLSHERIAAATGVSKGAVTKYLQRARDVGKRPAKSSCSVLFD